MTREEKKQLQYKFLELRVVEGKSFDSIRSELNVSKQTLINWSKELEGEIEILENAEKDSLIEEYRMSAKERLINHFTLYNRLKDELLTRDPASSRQCAF